LKPHVRVYLKEDFEHLTTSARNFSVDPKEDTFAQVSEAANEFFATCDPDDPRPILMCSEDLSGHMPGRHGLECYDSAGLVMKTLSDAVAQRFGPTTDLRFYFSTRGRETWLRSTWWQNLRSTRLTQDFPDYASQFHEARDLADILDEVIADVAPAKVTSCPLEASSPMPLGPLTPLLDLLDLPDLDRDALVELPPENVQPDIGIDAVFLALNRSGLSDRDVKDAKRSIRRMARRTAS
jgi:hypothetical protein